MFARRWVVAVLLALTALAPMLGAGAALAQTKPERGFEEPSTGADLPACAATAPGAACQDEGATIYVNGSVVCPTGAGDPSGANACVDLIFGEAVAACIVADPRAECVEPVAVALRPAAGGLYTSEVVPDPALRNFVHRLRITRYRDWDTDRPTENVTFVPLNTYEIWVVAYYRRWNPGDTLRVIKYERTPDGWRLVKRTREIEEDDIYGRSFWKDKDNGRPGLFSYVVYVNDQPANRVDFEIR